MHIIKPYVEIVQEDFDLMLRKIEWAGRKCHKSDDKISAGSSSQFIRNIRNIGHLSVFEHGSFSANFIVDRGVSHEIVRHRVASYSQESTRYCNYTNEKFGNQITVIHPFQFTEDSEEFKIWAHACRATEIAYMELDEKKVKAQWARDVLPNSLKTEIVMTANFREWRLFFSLRAAAPAHPQMRQVAIPLLLTMQELLPDIFDDLTYDTTFDPANYAEIKMITL